MNKPVLDTRQSLADFSGQVMVHCPKCDALAWVRSLGEPEQGLFAARRLACTRCFHVEAWPRSSVVVSSNRGRDTFFGHRLYLSVACGIDVVWVHNLEQLDYLQAWIDSPLRARRPDAAAGWSNASYLSRLPRWMKLARNRGKVSAALEKLRRKAAQALPGERRR